MQTVQVPSHVEIDIRRPAGNIETVTLPGRTQIVAREFSAMKDATAKAGRGECIAYRNITKAVAAPQPTAADLADIEYRRQTAAVYAMSAGGEADETTDRADNTPSNKSDF